MEPLIAVLLLALGVAFFAALWTFSSVLTLQRELRDLRAEVRSLHGKRVKRAAEVHQGAARSVDLRETTGPEPPTVAPTESAPRSTARPEVATDEPVTPAAIHVRALDPPAEKAPPRPVAAAAPERATGAPRKTSAARNSEPPFDWENLLGVRGAAIVGGIALVLAGIFFVQVAIERGWLGPVARDLLAFSIGAACLAMHAPLRSRGMPVLADSVGGAGAVLTYGASWAAARLHGLVSTPLALSVMTATTGVALFLAVKTKAPIVAAFALVGGFATPLLLDVVDSGSLGILVYILALNGVLLTFGRIRRWTWAWPMAALGSAAVEVAWLRAFGGDGGAWLPCLAIGAVVAGFLLAPPPSDETRPARVDARAERISFGISYTIVIAVALASALQVGLATSVSAGLWPTTMFAAILITAASIADKGIRARVFFPGASLAAVFLLVITLGEASRLEGSGGGDAVGAAFKGWTLACGCLGALVSALCFAFRRGAPALVHGLTGIALLRIATLAGRVEETAAFAPAMAAFVVFALFGSSRVKRSSMWGAVTGLLCGIVLSFQIAEVLGRTLIVDSALPWTASALAAGAAVASLTLGSKPSLGKALLGFALWAPLPILALTLEAEANLAAIQIAAAAVAAACLAAALARKTSAAVIQSMVITAAGSAATLWAWSLYAKAASIQDAPWSHFMAAAVLVVSPLAAMIAAAPKLRRHGDWLVWVAAAPAAAVVLGPSAYQVQYCVGAEWGWHVTVGAAALALLGSAGTLHVRGASSRLQRTRYFPMVMTLCGLAAAALAASASRAVAAQWHVVAAALGGGAIACFTLRARRKETGAAASLLAASGAALLIGLTFLGRAFLAEPFYLPIELSIDYGMAAAGVALAYAGSRSLRSGDDLRRSITAATAALLLALAFAWTNAAVLNRFTQGGPIRIELERLQHRDLAISIAWTSFAALTLGAGMWRRNLALRWTSLGLLVATIFKVFLYDLGALQGLSRVGSFLGLSVALLGVSVAYSRLLRTTEAAREPG